MTARRGDGRSSPLSLVPPPLVSVHAEQDDAPGEMAKGHPSPAVPFSGPIREWFRKARIFLGLSQSKLAREVGVDRRTVMRWESGETPIRGDAVDHLVRLVSEYREAA